MNDFKVGLQLYTVRDKIKELGFDEVLGRVSEAGYEYVELAGYYGFSADEILGLLKKHGLKCVSVHQMASAYFTDPALIDFIKKLGVEYIVIPHMKKEKLYGENWSETREEMLRACRYIHENGLKMLYHNHDFEFVRENGVFVYDKIMNDIPAERLKPQFDVCWVDYAGVDPCEYIEKYSGRGIDILHMKDYTCTGAVKGQVFDLIDEKGEGSGKVQSHEGFIQKPCGLGKVDFEKILKAAGMRPFEKILVANLANGERFETYAIPGPAGSGEVCLNGAAAHKGAVGDRLIVMSWCQATEAEAATHRPRVVRFDARNQPITK